MKYKQLIAAACYSLLATLPVNAEPIAKQLAGPPAEFPHMRSTALSNAATHSNSALIPVELKRSRDGIWRWSSQLPIEESDFRLALFSGASEDWQLMLRSPSGRVHETPLRLASEQRELLHGMANEEYLADYYRFELSESGYWTLEIAAPTATQTSGYILISSAGPHRMAAYQSSRNQWLGERIHFTALGFTEGPSLTDSQSTTPQAAAEMLISAQLRITAPSGAQWTEYLHDDGLHDDAKAGDGQFGGSFLANEMGNFTVQVVARGKTPDGMPLLRTTEHLVPVLERPAQLAVDFAAATAVDDTRMMVGIALGDRDEGKQFRTYAEVWGHSLTGGRTPLPVAWIGGMSTVRNGVLDIGLDARWISLAGVQAPFELRNVRIEDPDHFIPVLQSKRMALDIDRLPQAAFRSVRKVDEAMLMGPRPDIPTTARAGSRLLLVHGYCSEGPWGAVAHQFNNASVFLDLNQNRSHNEFALRLLEFGRAFNSYGIVASSQGGAAALHLYTYYWSGLDRASGGLLIQSVGTPYQGTSLAGNLAVLGRIFGVGCGTNTDLTYRGAAAWLSGIPAWARSQVNYHTTSFEDKWWRYDYCHLVSDLLLRDPDDGTTERSRGQLAFAINRGHKTGWCHTSGMRDPAQTADSVRNRAMNASAAR